MTGDWIRASKLGNPYWPEKNSLYESMHMIVKNTKRRSVAVFN
jgi:hypothetical protein